jgi:Skp family chaperone for outer membrane proteins
MTKYIAVAVTVSLGALFAAGNAWAQQAKIAVIDMRMVTEQYKGWQERVQQLNEFRRDREQQYRDAVRTAYLTPEERAEYNLLRRDLAPTTDDLRRLMELRDKSEGMEEELNFLRKIDQSELTEAQIGRRNELDATFAKAQQDLDELRKRLNREIEGEDRRLAEQADQEIKDAIAAYVKEKTYDIVLAKETVVWGGTDITEEIVERLNKGAS